MLYTWVQLRRLETIEEMFSVIQKIILAIAPKKQKIEVRKKSP